MLELMIAIGVLLVATLAAFGTQVASFQLIDSSRDSTVAMTDLELAMEELLTQSLDDMPVIYPPDEALVGFNGLHLAGESITPSYPGFAAGDTPPDPLNIVLTASWQDSRGRDQLLTLSTMKTR